MTKRLSLVISVAAAICLCGFAVACAQDEPAHKITAQEVAEAMADPAGAIKYFNLSYRAYMDAGPFDDTNNELRLNGAGFINLPDGSALMYRAFLPYYVTDFPDDSGFGDMLLSAYWVPGKSNAIIGPGVALMVPSASEDYYGTGKWSIGPTLVGAYKVPGHYTLGGLLTHIWSFMGDDDRYSVLITTIMPAFTYFIGPGRSISLVSETTYNWDAEEDNLLVPLTLGVGQILPPFGRFFVGVGLGGTYYVEKSEYAQDWDLRATASIVFP